MRINSIIVLLALVCISAMPKARGETLSAPLPTKTANKNSRRKTVYSRQRKVKEAPFLQVKYRSLRGLDESNSNSPNDIFHIDPNYAGSGAVRGGTTGFVGPGGVWAPPPHYEADPFVLQIRWD